MNLLPQLTLRKLDEEPHPGAVQAACEDRCQGIKKEEEMMRLKDWVKDQVKIMGSREHYTKGFLLVSIGKRGL